MINQPVQENLIADLTSSIELGISYLYDHQYPNGEFCCYYAPDDKMQEWCVPDSTVFPAALIASCLLPMKDSSAKAKKILASVAGFLSYQVMRGGVWNYYTKWNSLFKYCPADADDTVFASYVLKSLDIDFPDNTAALLGNRNSKGLFYTWFVLRPKLHANTAYWKVASRELKRPLNTLGFWLKHECSRKDIDAVVNANILFYLGLNHETKPVISYLLNIVASNNAADNDHWYKNAFTFYYFLSRNYKLIKELEPARNTTVEWIYASLKDDGSFGDSILDTALAISTLVNFGHKDKILDQAVHILLNSQNASGCWERNIFSYSGPSKVVGWGSEEMVTGYCLEALHKYSNLVITI